MENPERMRILIGWRQKKYLYELHSDLLSVLLPNDYVDSPPSWISPGILCICESAFESELL